MHGRRGHHGRDDGRDDGRDWRDPMSVMRTRSESDEEYARLASPQLLDRLPNDPENILLSIGAEVYRLNVRTNRSERIQRAGERTIGGGLGGSAAGGTGSAG